MLRSQLLGFAAAAALATIPPASAQAGTVTFTGIVANTCVLNVTTPGLLGASSDGTTLSSETTGGVAAVLAVISTGSAPTMVFTAPTLNGPTGWSGTPVVSIRMNALSGATQAYTSSGFSAQLSQLLDTLTINAKAVNARGFASGTYTLASTVTCQQS